jgi:hypothetical protein
VNFCSKKDISSAKYNFKTWPHHKEIPDLPKNVSAFNIKREETGDPIPKIQQNLVGAV